jgi:TolB protein
MGPRSRLAALVLFGLAGVVGLVLLPAPLGRRPPPRVERVTHVRMTGRDGALPRVAVEPFATAGGGPDLSSLATLLGDVVRADLAFENVFDLQDGVASATGAPGADWTLSGRVSRDNGALHLEVRIHDAAGRLLVFGREFVGAVERSRFVAHVAANAILADQAGLQGLAHTRLAFVSDRAGTFHEPTGSFRHVKEIYVADYDGANETRVTFDGDLDLFPSWSPDARSLAYTSFRRGYQDLFITRLEDRRLDGPTAGRGKNWLPAWSPDGTTIAFTSNREGNEEIYVMNVDGSDTRRLTRHWAIDTSPAWSPDGRRIAFTSNRTGSPQIWVMEAGGANPHAVTSEKYCDRPSWSPGPADEIVYVSKTRTGFDIKVVDLATLAVRQLTFGPQNESPTFSPTGRHIAFTSTRSGSQQIWTMTRLGEDLRQVTHVGNNSTASWSR